MLHENLLKQENKKFVKFMQALEDITIKDIKICEMRYIDGMTLREVGEKFNITNERVRQIIERTKKKIIAMM